jgi:acetyltransferase-like isoleucine patch superfamily enzyme
VKRIIKIIKKIKSPSSENLSDYTEISSSTILPNGLQMRFDTGKDKRKYVTIGDKGIIKANFIFESKKGEVIIGNNVHIGGATIISRKIISIGNDVTMAWDITIYDHDSHSIQWDYRKNDNHQCYNDYLNHNGNNVINKDWAHVNAKPIIIKDKVWIGFGVTILKGVTIGEGAVIGAKSVITKDVPDWTVVAGNPARVLKQLNKEK